MKYSHLLSGLLVAAQTLGLLLALLLFLLCFFGVHAVKLLRVGWAECQRAKKAKKSPPPEKKEEGKAPPKEEKAPASQEPIYYIVERKRRRARSAPRSSYGEPKQISFK